ncbi:hypothetical protein ES332_A06G223800v1 [Gossypium tomentosum]|uniref:Uncharacterized protein n=1 Tax=Gossypium tomentosum TaxID=34277 RepID=A0A5D2Q7F3_GOSTO|nr:hypothetical protein ES332_A06G223800v1 [Gossypium tomentosum]
MNKARLNSPTKYKDHARKLTIQGQKRKSGSQNGSMRGSTSHNRHRLVFCIKQDKKKPKTNIYYLKTNQNKGKLKPISLLHSAEPKASFNRCFASVFGRRSSHER